MATGFSSVLSKTGNSMDGNVGQVKVIDKALNIFSPFFERRIIFEKEKKNEKNKKLKPT